MKILDKAKTLVRNATDYIESYRAWASKQALNRLDLLAFGLGPIALLAVGLMSLPAWICRPVAALLAWPVLYATFLVLRTYAQRGKK